MNKASTLWNTRDITVAIARRRGKGPRKPSKIFTPHAQRRIAEFSDRSVDSWIVNDRIREAEALALV